MRPLDILSRREKAWPFGLRALVGFCLPLLIGEMGCMVLRYPDLRSACAQACTVLLYVLAFVLPIGLRPKGTSSGFMETVLLTRVSPREWLDARVGKTLRRVWAWGGATWVTAVLLKFLSEPGDVGQVLTWLPTVTLLAVSVAYFEAIRPAEMPGRRWALAALGVCIGGLSLTWAVFDTPTHLISLDLAPLLLVLIRGLMLEHMVLGATPSRSANKPAAAIRTRSRNPIVRRESCRAARRGVGGVFAMVVRRYGVLLLAATLLVLAMGSGNGSRGDDLAVGLTLTLWALIGAVCTYWTTVQSVTREATHQTSVLLSVSKLSSSEFTRGWLAWALRARWVEAIVLGLAVAAYLCLHYDESSPYPGNVLFWLGIYGTAIGTGLLASGAAARAGLAASQRGRKGWAAHAMCVAWLVPCLTIAYEAMGYCYDQNSMVLYLASPLAISVGALFLAEFLMQRAFSPQ